MAGSKKRKLDGKQSIQKGKEKENSQVEASWKMFDQVLKDVMLPPVINRSSTPRSSSPNESTVVMLSEPDYRLIVGLEGGRQATCAVFLVLTPDWLEKRDGDLYLHKGIWFDSQHQGYCDSFEPPRRVTYFANFFTFSATTGVRNDGVPLEEGLNCPMSSSHKLEKIINDKLLTRCLMGNSGVACPRTLAFPYASDREYPVGNLQITLVNIADKKDADKAFLEKHLKLFLNLYKDIRSIVVKASGPMWQQSEGVSIFPNIEMDKVVDAMYALLQRLQPYDSLLIDEFLPTLRSQVVLPAREAKIYGAIVPGGSVMSQKHFAAKELLENLEQVQDDEMAYSVEPPKIQLGFRLRVLVARTSFNTSLLSKFVVGVGDLNKPINGDNTIPQSLESALDQWGIVQKSKQELLKKTIREEAELTLSSIIQYEANNLTDEQRGGKRAQTDLIGLDIILTNKFGVITPFIIEVNDHDCTLQAQMLELLLPETLGECVRPWVSTMLLKSQSYLLSEKTVLIIGGGGLSKNFVWEVAKEHEIKIVLVDQDPNHYAKPKVHHFIHFPGLEDHSKDLDMGNQIVKELKKRKLEVDGVLTFWEDCGPIANYVAELLGKIGNPYQVHLIAKSKMQTHKVLLEKKGSWPHKVSTHYFAVPSLSLHSESEISKGLELVPLPAVLKIEHGSSAVGVKLVTTKKETIQTYRLLASNFKDEEDHPGSGLSFKSSVVLMEYIDGSEHDIDIVMWDGCVLAAFVTDNGPTRLPYFAESAASMPSILHSDKEAALISAACQCCLELGLRYGVFNVEMKLTAIGPRLIEINARPGGFYIRDWIKMIWGIDLALCAFSIACGIKPIVQKAPTPRTYIVGVHLYSSQHGKALKSITSLERLHQLHDEGMIRCNFYEDHVVEEAEFEEPLLNIACQGNSLDEAKEKLVSTLGVLGLDSASVPVSWYLQYLDLV